MRKFEGGYNPLNEIKDKILKRDIPGARFIEIEKIMVKDQVRKNFENIQELADSIKEHGLINPLTVKKEGENFILISGERRYHALKLLGEKNVQVIERDIKDEDVLFVQLIENIQREDLNPIDLAEAYKELQKFGLSARDIAKKIGKSHEHVNQTLALLKLDKNLKEKVASGLPPTKAIEISKLDKKTQKEILKDPEKYSRDEIKKIKNGTENQKLEQEDEKVVNGLPPSKAIEISETLISAANKFNEENLNIKISVISKENISILAHEEVLIECIKKIKKNKTALSAAAIDTRSFCLKAGICQTTRSRTIKKNARK